MRDAYTKRRNAVASGNRQVQEGDAFEPSGLRRLAKAFAASLSQRGHDYRAMLVNATSLVGTIGITSLLGFVYWGIAARRFTPQAVGFASASTSSMMLLGTISQMGLGTMLMGELPRRSSNRVNLILAASLASGAVGGTLALAFAFYIAPVATPGLGPLGTNVGRAALFTAGVALTAVAMVVDKALVGLLRGGLQFWRNAIMAAAKVVALLVTCIWVADRFGMAIFGAWVIGYVISFVAVLGYAVRQGMSVGALRPDFGLLRGMGRTALGHHALNLTLQIPALTLPLIVTATLTTTMNAYFYTAWLIAGFVFAGPNALTTVLYAVAATDRAKLANRIRFTLILSGIIGIAANVVLIVGAGLVLRVFGRAYADHAANALRIVSLGVFPLTIKSTYVAICRIYGRVTDAAVRLIGGCCLELIMAAAGALIGGLSGLCAGWLVGILIEALLMARRVLKAAHDD